jgi:hypothetical protein
MRSAVYRATVLGLVFLVAGIALRAQTSGHIRGTVVDDDGNPLAGVQVQAIHASASRATKTGKDGQFRFSMVPPGSYKVRFFLPAYSEVEKNATVRLDGTATVDAKLFRL